jgi:hypothetical protein
MRRYVCPLLGCPVVESVTLAVNWSPGFPCRPLFAVEPLCVYFYPPLLAVTTIYVHPGCPDGVSGFGSVESNYLLLTPTLEDHSEKHRCYRINPSTGNHTIRAMSSAWCANAKQSRVCQIDPGGVDSVYSLGSGEQLLCGREINVWSARKPVLELDYLARFDNFSHMFWYNIGT